MPVEIENAPGKGMYTLNMTVGEVASATSVLALQFSGPAEMEAYIYTEFEGGQPFVIFRCGSQGVCRIQFNPGLTITDMIFKGCLLGAFSPTRIHYEGNDRFTPKFLQPGDVRSPSSLEVVGETVEGKQFQIKITHTY